MADNDTTTTNSVSGNGKGAAGRRANAARSSAARGSARSSRASEGAMKKQIADLKREVSRLNRALADQAEEAQGWYQSATERASSLYSGASGRASRAARQLRSQAHSVSETVQQNPGTISTAFMFGGVVGVLIGMTIARQSAPDPDWFHRWRR
ncbi:hypothetical protein SAMN03159463_04063 [Mesorhizobium sp. NFR06]|uniref:hypothetical protein n=1 Tax=Mesorhizobium sp. NFR06 TaxID=1566290 RepID=UPI0008F17E25|nr:hypothetical protein [Mesorhizobium sp. NFR06]SFP35263.1 hypothetical protein SAMN03159463_04063 [Mesorhizobium sp. NFR06]